MFIVLPAGECDNMTTTCVQNCVRNITSGEDICSCNRGFYLNADGYSCDGEKHVKYPLIYKNM